MLNDDVDCTNAEQDGKTISSSVCRFLKHAADILGPMTVATELVAEDIPASVYRWPSNADTFGNEHLIVVPSDSSTDPSAVLSCMRERYRDVRTLACIFVDCFGCVGTRNSLCATPDGVIHEHDSIVVSPEQLWLSVLPDSINPFGGYASACADELRLNEREYVERFLLSPTTRDGTRLTSITDENDSALEYLQSWRQDFSESPRKLLLFGEAGCGKTWLLRKFAMRECERTEQNPWRAPRIVYVDLLAPTSGIFFSTGFESVLAYNLVKNGYAGAGLATAYYLEALIRSGQLVILLDEFDTITRQFKQEIVEYQYDHLVRNLPFGARVIVATRATRFSSRTRMIELFCQPMPAERGSPERQVVDQTENKTGRVFGALTISYFTRDDVSTLLTKVCDDRELAAERLRVLDRDEHLMQLMTVPRHVDAIRLFLWDDALGNNAVFELTVAWLICFNLVTGRALYTLHYWEGNVLREDTLDLHTRMKILGDIAWFLLDFQRADFDSDEMKYSILSFAVSFFEEAINDLKCQTLFDFTDWRTTNLQFRLPVLRSYFIARMFYSLLLEDDTCQIGLRRLGKHDLNRKRDDATSLGFMKWFFEKGYLYVPPDEDARRKEDVSAEGYWSTHTKRAAQENVLKEAGNLLRAEPAFSSWTRHLVRNLDACGLDTSELRQIDEWTAGANSLSGYDGILIHGISASGDNVLPFVISPTEVTNEAYDEHLMDTEFVPRMVPCDPPLGRDQSEERNTRHWHIVEFDAATDHIHPLDWRIIHRRTDARDRLLLFRNFTNDYHLFSWRDGDVPPKAEECPVVWVSFYVAAIYCNWRTLKSGLTKDDLAYEIYLDADEKPVLFLRQEACGFRLPLAEEWVYAARANDEHEYIWEGKGEVLGTRLREMLLSEQQAPLPVTRSYANAFGVYGLIGNVREWAESAHRQGSPNTKAGKSVHGVPVPSTGLVMGSTAALGEATFAYSHECLQHGMHLPRVNTNPDVGFRLARSIDRKNRTLIAEAQVKKHGRLRRQP